jgi:hypothetical protein
VTLSIWLRRLFRNRHNSASRRPARQVRREEVIKFFF